MKSETLRQKGQRILASRENLLENPTSHINFSNQMNDKRLMKKTSAISDIFEKTLEPLSSSIPNDFENTIKFEDDYPFFSRNSITESTSNEAKENSRFNYKELKTAARNKGERIFLYLIKKKISLSTINQLVFGVSNPRIFL